MNLEVNTLDTENIPVTDYWSDNTNKEARMHRIHYYPAKFPSFIVSKSLDLAKERNIKVTTIADIFCGCGTTALEARRNGINFWGCDINPVATLIAQVKSETYDESLLLKYFQKITDKVKKTVRIPTYYTKNDRIKYWFSEDQISELYYLLNSIKTHAPKGKYQNFFLCAFSNILKPSSRWLTKSIKPQIDPKKIVPQVGISFSKQFNYMLKANREEITMSAKHPGQIDILNKNYLKVNVKKPFVDLVVTSPPYVTSYEYADLHQLSALWLYPNSDYRSLRKGSIGTVYHTELSKSDIESLNSYSKEIYDELHKKSPSRAKSVMKYFYDLKKTVGKTKSILKSGGLAIFVIGNTEYLGTTVDNARYLKECLVDCGFEKVETHKRIIRGKTLSPYRDKKGRFSSNSKDRKVYRYEFVIIAENGK